MTPIRFGALVASLFFGCDLAAQQPARKDSRSYLIVCKVTRAAVETDTKGRPILERTTTTLPEITTLENAKAEYVSERKIDAGVYQFRLQVQIQKISEGKVRLDLQLEDTWAEGALDKPLLHRHALQTARQTALGSKLKLALQEKNDKDEGIWVELTVKELTDDE